MAWRLNQRFHKLLIQLLEVLFQVFVNQLLAVLLVLKWSDLRKNNLLHATVLEGFQPQVHRA